MFLALHPNLATIRSTSPAKTVELSTVAGMGPPARCSGGGVGKAPGTSSLPSTNGSDRLRINDSLIDRSSSASSYASSSSCRNSSAAEVTLAARSIPGEVGPRAYLEVEGRKGNWGDLPFGEVLGAGMRSKSSTRFSRVSVSGSDQRLGNGILAVTRSSTPEVSRMGNEGGIRLLIS